MKYREQILSLIWLDMIFGVGNRKIWELLKLYQDPVMAISKLYSGPKLKALHLTEYNYRRIQEIRPRHVEAVMRSLTATHQSVVWYGDPLYPSMLYTLENPPVLLFYQGDLSLLQRRLLLTLVGTRNPTQYSLRAEQALCQELLDYNVVPMTGFAVGIDIAANICALERGMPSVAVMGCGLDVAYPRQNSPLKTKLAENGLMLTEFLPGTEPRGTNFPIRNRLLAALSPCTLVIQAPYDSGALITAEYALELGRRVLCLPPADIFDKRYLGVVEYLQKGAMVVTKGQQILRALDEQGANTTWKAGYLVDINYEDLKMPAYTEKSSRMISQLEQKLEQAASETQGQTPEAAEPEIETWTATAPEPTPEPAPIPSATASAESAEEDSGWDAQTLAVLRLLQQSEAMDIDQLAQELEQPVSQLYAILTELELFGKIQRMPGKQYRLK